MKRIQLIGVFASASVVLAVLAYAQTPRPALKINMGAWEISTAVDLGQMPGVDPSKMTPEQKARMDALRAARGNAAPRTRKSCLTPENFNNGAFLDEDPAGMTCTRTIATNTASIFESTRTCTGDSGSRTEHVRFESTSPTSFTAHSTAGTTRGGRTMNANVTITGKWLGADCTGIK